MALLAEQVRPHPKAAELLWLCLAACREASVASPKVMDVTAEGWAVGAMYVSAAKAPRALREVTSRRAAVAPLAALGSAAVASASVSSRAQRMAAAILAAGGRDAW